jgi:hypothetical protein
VCAYEADTLHDATDDQDPAQEKDDCHRRDHRIDQCQNARDNHQGALQKVQGQMPLDRLAHRLAHDLFGSFE